jgi:hypothetical protein
MITGQMKKIPDVATKPFFKSLPEDHLTETRCDHETT